MMSGSAVATQRAELAAEAVRLGALSVSGWSPEESQLIGTIGVGERARSPGTTQQQFLWRDPLGETFSRVFPPEDRRELGATYTPHHIVKAMIDWAATRGEPDRVVDPGCGSGRFLVEAGLRFSSSRLIGIEIDPVAALMARANLAVAGLAERAEVRLADYRSFVLPPIRGKTLFVGNPPYVRHHRIAREWKQWLVCTAERRGLVASQLAGLHAYFFLATADLARVGDCGAFITAAEWLDVNYGQLVRDLFVGPLGGQSILVIEPSARPFPDAATTAAIATFAVGDTTSPVRLRSVANADDLALIGSGALVRRDRLASDRRWTHLLRAARKMPEGCVELGELCRVHRGQVTGANRIWIEGEHSSGLPQSVFFPSVTRARELFEAGVVLDRLQHLRRVIDLPSDLDELPRETLRLVEKFLRWARARGVQSGYVARHRRAWWSVGLREAPPIMATYMARRPPAFVENRVSARYINIAHGLYPREPMSRKMLRALVRHLREASVTARGRTYAGGLMKFEPREMERLPVPRPELLT